MIAKCWLDCGGVDITMSNAEVADLMMELEDAIVDMEEMAIEHGPRGYTPRMLRALLAALASA